MRSKNKQNVAIFYGGYGPEFDISLQSAQFIQSLLAPMGWKLYLVEVSKSGYRAFDLQKNLLDFLSIDFTIIEKSEKHKIDVAFNAIHGPPGEDGELAKLFEKHQIPHTSCNSEVAQLTFDKHRCLSRLERIGINRPKYLFSDKLDVSTFDLVGQKVGYPCFVKPARSGSSFGISKVEHKLQLIQALKHASVLDRRILIEKAIEGTEVSVGMVPWKNKTVVLPMTELVSQNPFFDYEAKYLGKSDEITPARISKQKKNELETIAKKIYSYLGLKGATRSEFIVQQEKIYLLEVNTVPGFTSVSILPQQLQSAGIDLIEFFGDLVGRAIE